MLLRKCAVPASVANTTFRTFYCSAKAMELNLVDLSSELAAGEHWTRPSKGHLPLLHRGPHRTRTWHPVSCTVPTWSFQWKNSLCCQPRGIAFVRHATTTTWPASRRSRLRNRRGSKSDTVTAIHELLKGTNHVEIKGTVKDTSMKVVKQDSLSPLEGSLSTSFEFSEPAEDESIAESLNVEEFTLPENYHDYKEPFQSLKDAQSETVDAIRSLKTQLFLSKERRNMSCRRRAGGLLIEKAYRKHLQWWNWHVLKQVADRVALGNLTHSVRQLARHRYYGMERTSAMYKVDLVLLVLTTMLQRIFHAYLEMIYDIKLLAFAKPEQPDLSDYTFNEPSPTYLEKLSHVRLALENLYKTHTLFERLINGQSGLNRRLWLTTLLRGNHLGELKYYELTQPIRSALNRSSRLHIMTARVCRTIQDDSVRRIVLRMHRKCHQNSDAISIIVSDIEVLWLRKVKEVNDAGSLLPHEAEIRGQAERHLNRMSAGGKQKKKKASLAELIKEYHEKLNSLDHAMTMSENRTKALELWLERLVTRLQSDYSEQRSLLKETDEQFTDATIKLRSLQEVMSESENQARSLGLELRKQVAELHLSHNGQRIRINDFKRIGVVLLHVQARAQAKQRGSTTTPLSKQTRSSELIHPSLEDRMFKPAGYCSATVSTERMTEGSVVEPSNGVLSQKIEEDLGIQATHASPSSSSVVGSGPTNPPQSDKSGWVCGSRSCQLKHPEVVQSCRRCGSSRTDGVAYDPKTCWICPNCGRVSPTNVQWLRDHGSHMLCAGCLILVKPEHCRHYQGLDSKQSAGAGLLLISTPIMQAPHNSSVIATSAKAYSTSSEGVNKVQDTMWSTSESRPTSNSVLKDIENDPANKTSQNTSPSETNNHNKDMSMPPPGDGDDGKGFGNQEQGSDSEEDTIQEVHIPLSFQIPPDTLRAAMSASPSSGAAYWRHELYRGLEDERVSVHYCKTMEVAERVAQHFADEKVLGFDIEWKPNASPKDGIKGNTSLLQLACEDRIALFHLSIFEGDTIEELLPPTIQKIMESPDIMKVGVGVKSDCTRLRNHLGIDSRGQFELSHLYKVVQYGATEPRKVNKILVNLARQVREHLQLPLAKGEVRSSDWSKPLGFEQVIYAASDAYAGFRVFDALEAKRKAMKPTPPRPELAELNKPIILAKVIKAVSNISETGAVDDNSDNSEAYETAPEEQEEESDEEASSLDDGSDDSLDEASQGFDSEAEYIPPTRRIGRVRLALSADPARPTFEEVPQSIESSETEALTSQIDRINLSSPSSPPHNTESAATTQTPRPSLVILSAETWIQHYLAQTPSSSSRQPPSKPQLRAYSLWHHQSLSVPEIAAILRDPPLAESTVRSYVCAAVVGGKLEYDKERMRDVVRVLPISTKGKFGWLVT